MKINDQIDPTLEIGAPPLSSTVETEGAIEPA
jgi:hypothetical protein